jgi:lysophospholipase L1-like esterase
MAGCSGGSHSETDAPSAATSSHGSPSTSAESRRAPLRVVIVGDSNSTGFRGTLETGLAEGAAWGSQLPSDQFTIVGGWAMDGATTASMREGIESFGGEADHLVMMGGTNDLATGAALEDVRSNLAAVAREVGAKRVTILAIPPFDYLPAEAMALNRSLGTLAEDNGWRFLDPWADLREADGTWSAEFRTDGIHTSVEGYALAGRDIAAHLVP